MEGRLRHRQGKTFKLKDDLVDVLRYIAMSRPDWFERPELDIYGRLVEEEEDEPDTIDFLEVEEGDLLQDRGDILVVI